MVQTELNQREILEKDFASKLRGYDPQEVDEFLDIIIRDYKAFDNHIEDLKKENNRLSKSVDSMYKRLETATKKNKALNKQLDDLRSSSSQNESQQTGSDNRVDVDNQSSLNKERQLQNQQEKLSQESRAEQADDLQRTRIMKSPVSIKNPVKGSRDAHEEPIQARDQHKQIQSQDSPNHQPKSSRPSATILDLLKRVSNLEKAVFGEENADN